MQGGRGCWRSWEAACPDWPQYLRDVLLADHMLTVLDVLCVPGDEDPSPLAAAVWFADERSGFPHASVGLEIPIAARGRGDSYKLQKDSLELS